ncbi:MAG: cyclase family protein [Chloroflexota bacterium]
MKIHDLTLQVRNGRRGITITKKTSSKVEGYNTTDLLLYSHSGTHLDAPLHFLDDGATLDTMPLEKCVGPAMVIDLTHKAPNSLITVEDLAHVADQIQAQSRVLLRTDWDSKADDPEYRTSFPRISLELAEWLAEKEIWLIGLEHPSVASLQDKEELTAVHQALLKKEIVIVESLANLRKLPPHVTFIALPLKVKDGDGSPVRAIAIEQ